MIGDFEQRRVALSTGIELDVVDMGPKEAPALIFLHGFPESHRTWRYQLPHFADRFRCIAPDQRGYRGSSKPQDAASYSGDKLIADIFALADALGVGTFTIVGHDWGGAIAWGVALGGQPDGLFPAWSGRVTRAVIANAPNPAIFQKLLLTNPDQRAASQYIRTFRDPASDAIIEAHGIAGLLAHAFADKVPSGGIQPPDEIARSLKDWEDRDTCRAMINWYRGSAVTVPAMDEPYAEPPAMPFPKLAIPTLVIWALDDVALPPCNLDGIEELVPDATIVEVPGCGHFVPWEAPDAVNTAMDDFLAQS
ncbi:alpha/beta fold hydrolase [Sphingopyxis macrogoltabida]|uniref:Alpha/beta hydrolase n=1 Tax=Sphingopyxis macrogoltabida TaxID=33050 RepID=A0AAC8YXQ2_SPHMC|nr:alpha/beta hydrolase [Sphingopyxis macrogoltabida]ALJ11878.1 alpha/beta hydrolase [Sphingopyxis macrogoltabida]AMU88062.1 alpha/beta hydrolase [Sphingopyxis macrogoltabida]